MKVNVHVMPEFEMGETGLVGDEFAILETVSVQGGEQSVFPTICSISSMFHGTRYTPIRAREGNEMDRLVKTVLRKGTDTVVTYSFVT